MKTIVERAKSFAINIHSQYCSEYDGKPYYVHLNKIINIANIYIDLIPVEQRDNVLAACWLHDTMEDCSVKYYKLHEIFNTTIADIVYAVTDDKGKTRKDRHSERYYDELLTTPFALFVKLCDRIANVEYSIDKNSNKIKMYRKEQDEFIQNLSKGGYVDMFNRLNDTIWKIVQF